MGLTSRHMLPKALRLCTQILQELQGQMKSAGKKVFLIGPMGSGKTTIGRLVAEELGLEFHDCDHELEQSTGASVGLIFDVEGEAGFRDRETQMLRNMVRLDGVLVSTGGGAVTRQENRELMSSNGLVVWLKTSVQQQLARLSHDKNRPLLQTGNREESLKRLACERNPYYRDLADLVFVSPDRNSRITARALSQAIREHWESQAEGKTHACR